MLTKSATAITKQALLAPLLMGGLRASSLTEEQKEALRKKYHLASGDSLELRNFGRGVAGDIGGGLLGTGLTLAALASRNPTLAGLGLLAPLAGSLGGTWLATNKYSRSNPLFKNPKETPQ